MSIHQPQPLVFLGHRSFDGASISAVMPLARILSCDSVETANIIRASLRTQVTVLEEDSNTRERWSSAHIDSLLKSTIQQIIAYRGNVDLLPYAATSLTDRLLTDKHVRRLYSISADLRNTLDDKRYAKQIFKKLNLPSIDAVIDRMSEVTILSAAQRFGYPLVVRAPTGSTGSSIFRVDSVRSALKLAGRLQHRSTIRQQWIFEPFIDGTSLNVNAIVLRDRTIIYAPSIQLIGIPECTDLDFGYCGNDFVAAAGLQSEAMRECERQTTLIGNYLADLRYQGLFGVDYILDPRGIVIPCEINPRFQNSTALLNFMTAGNPSLSPARLHVECFAAPPPTPASNFIPSESPFSQVIVYSDTDRQLVNTAALKDGLYNVTPNHELLYVTPTFDPRELGTGQLILTESLSRAGMRVMPGAPLAKILCKQAVTNDSGVICEHIRQVIKAVTMQLRMVGTTSEL